MCSPPSVSQNPHHHHTHTVSGTRVQIGILEAVPLSHTPTHTPVFSSFLSQPCKLSEGSIAQRIKKKKKDKRKPTRRFSGAKRKPRLTFFRMIVAHSLLPSRWEKQFRYTGSHDPGEPSGLYCSFFSFPVSSQLSCSSSWTRNSSGGHRSSPLSTSPSVGSTTMEGRRSFSLQHRSKSDGSGKI